MAPPFQIFTYLAEGEYNSMCDMAITTYLQLSICYSATLDVGHCRTLEDHKRSTACVGHVCCAGHPYEGLSSLSFWKAIAACEQEEPCKEASVQAPRVLRVATQGTTCTIACASYESVPRRELLPLYAIVLLHLLSCLTPRACMRDTMFRRSLCRGCDVAC